MATSRKKNGQFVGKLGNTVSYWLNGKWVKRTIGINNNPPTALQLAVRKTLALIAGLLKPVKGFVKLGFALEVKDPAHSPYNIAVIENKIRGLKGEYPHLEINYPEVIFSKGTVTVNKETLIEVVATGLIFTWNPDLLLSGMASNDRVMMVAYCPEKKYAFYELDGARRSEGRDYLPLLKYKERVIIHTYVAFIASDRKSISTTHYTGEFLW